MTDVLDIGVCVDPGHGGTDRGAVYAGVHEADVNLAVARHMVDALALRLRLVVPTRVSDETTPMQRRLQVARHHGVQAFISIHANSFEGADEVDAVARERVRGLVVLYQPGSVSGCSLACALGRALATTGMRVNVQGRATDGAAPSTRNLAVLRGTAMPAALVELGFLPNDTDRALLTDPAWQQRAGIALACGVLDWCRPACWPPEAA